MAGLTNRIARALLVTVAVVAAACAPSDEIGGPDFLAATTAPGSTTSTSTSSPVTTVPATVEGTVTVETTLDANELNPVAGDPFAANAGLARTLNLGAVFEIPRDEDWGIPLDLADIDQIAEIGFTAVRIPVRWDQWAETEEPFTIDPDLHRRVDEVVDRALANGLSVIIDVHHYEALDHDPAGHRDRFLAIWRQVAEHNADLPPTVVFELLNEPNSALEGQILNDLLADAVSEIRLSNPDRTIMMGPGEWYAAYALQSLDLPDDDNLIISVHYYDPFPFTHQGASWVSGSDQWLGTGWDAESERAQMGSDLDFVSRWASERGVPVFIGEFGVVSAADRDNRLNWVGALVEESEARGFAWGYWDWATESFGTYNDVTEVWDEGLLDALLGPKQ